MDGCKRGVVCTGAAIEGGCALRRAFHPKKLTAYSRALPFKGNGEAFTFNLEGNPEYSGSSWCEIRRKLETN